MKRLVPLVLALLVGVPATAQTSEHSPRVWRQMEQQLVANLESAHHGIRHQAMENAIYYATLHPDEIDLRRTVPLLIRIHQKDGVEGNRELAAAALQVVGGKRATRYLARRTTQDEAERSRAIVSDVLAKRGAPASTL